MAGKRGLGKNVLDAARERIRLVLENFPKVYVSFSAGKDSTVLLHLVMEQAIPMRRKIGVLLVDLEGQYKLTIEHGLRCYEMYRDHIEPYWLCLPIALRNAVSMYEPKWLCWDPDRKTDWIRQPPDIAITKESLFPFFHRGMEFEEFVDKFGQWYGGEEPTACLVGIRADESLNRYRTLIMQKSRFQNLQWTTYKGGTVYNAYPIYDWRTSDVWVYNGKTGKPYNNLYDLMHKAGLTISQQRICQPYGDDQRKGLWLFHVIEPETWARVVARVNGANSGSMYAQETGNILGRIKISKPEGHNWQSFAKLLMASLPPRSQEHFRDKITVFLRWWYERGFSKGIPDEAPAQSEANKETPSWRRICRALLRNDYWCKGLSFSQTKSESYAKYKKIMENRRRRWGISW